MSNPANTFLKSFSRLCDRVPTPCWGGTATLFTPTQLLRLSCELSAPAAWLYLYSGTVLNITVPFPYCDPEACRLPQLNQRVEILHL